MKYLRQFTIILSFTFSGEVIHTFLPLPVPASIYGLVLLVYFLWKNYIKPEEIRESALLLIEIMPLLFIPDAAGLVKIWDKLVPILFPFTLITIIATFAVIAVSGKFAEVVGHYTKEKTNVQMN